MTTARTRTFRSGGDQAIRLPAEVAFGEDTDLVIVRSGNVLTIYPPKESIPTMVARLRALRVPPAIESRDIGDLPKRQHER